MRKCMIFPWLPFLYNCFPFNRHKTTCHVWELILFENFFIRISI
jgi:hypothetical protein